MTIASSTDASAEVSNLLAVIADPTAAAALLAKLKDERDALAREKAEVFSLGKVVEEARDANALTGAGIKRAAADLLDAREAHEREVAVFDQQKAAFITQKDTHAAEAADLAASSADVARWKLALGEREAALISLEGAVAEREIAVAKAEERLAAIRAAATVV